MPRLIMCQSGYPFSKQNGFRNFFQLFQAQDPRAIQTGWKAVLQSIKDAESRVDGMRTEAREKKSDTERRNLHKQANKIEELCDDLFGLVPDWLG